MRGIVCREHVDSWKCEIHHNEELRRLREERWIQAYEEHQYHYDILNKLLHRLLEMKSIVICIIIIEISLRKLY